MSFTLQRNRVLAKEWNVLGEKIIEPDWVLRKKTWSLSEIHQRICVWTCWASITSSVCKKFVGDFQVQVESKWLWAHASKFGRRLSIHYTDDTKL